MNILLIKHGKTDYNLEGKRQGRTDLPLNEMGKKEVLKLKKKIKRQTEIVFSSPLKRATQTAQLLFPDEEITIDKRLIEYDFGELEGIPFSTPLEKFPDNKIEEYNGKTFLMPKNGETFDDIVSRCREFLAYPNKSFKNTAEIAIVTHSTNFEILKALVEKKPWHTYLANAKQFHGFVEIKI